MMDRSIQKYAIFVLAAIALVAVVALLWGRNDAAPSGPPQPEPRRTNAEPVVPSPPETPEPAEEPVPPLEDEPSEPTDGELGSISGIVVDALGNPASQVLVGALPRGPSKGEPKARATKMDGQFAIDGLAANTYVVKLRAVADRDGPGHEAATVTLAPGQHVEDLELVFTGGDGLTISGRVTNTDGEPVQGALLNASFVSGESDSRCEAITGSDGRYILSGLSAGPHWVNLWHEQYGSINPVEVEAGSRNVDFVMGSRPTIEGQVLDRRTGTPIPDFELIATTGTHNHVQQWMRSGFTPHHHSEGCFSVEIDRPGDATVAARVKGYAAELLQFHDLRSGETRSGAVLRLVPGGTIHGVVMDKDAAPIEGAEVHVGLDVDTPHGIRPPAASTDADGAFQLDSLEAGRMLLTISHPDYALNVTALEIVSGQVIEPDIVLDSGGCVEGVVTCDGQPASGQALSTFYPLTGQHGSSVKTDERGAYRFTMVAPGLVRVRLYAHLLGGIELHQIHTLAHVEPGGTTQVDFPLTTGTASFSGVVMVHGQPASGLQIRLRQVCSDTLTWTTLVRSRAENTFELQHLPVGPFDIELGAFDARGTLFRRDFHLDLQDAESVHLDVEITEGKRLTGHITGGLPYCTQLRLYRGTLDADAFTIGARTIDAFPGAFLRFVPVAPDATYTVTGLDPGTYTLLAVCEQSQPDMWDALTAIGHIQIADEDEYRLDLVLQ